LTLLATLHGLEICAAELQLAKGLRLAHPDALAGLPPEALPNAGAKGGGGHLLVVHSIDEQDPVAGQARGLDLLRELLRALRLFGDGRVTLGVLGWVRLATGAFSPVAIGAGGRPRGVLVVTADQEDELRAFCSLVSRRAPARGELAWALRRFELGCDRDSPREALTDHLLALRALLEPEGPASGLLAGRVAALCATPEERAELAHRVLAAIELERAVIAGASAKESTVRAAGEELASHLRALLSDVICGHLDADLAALADELLLADAEDEQEADEQLELEAGEEGGAASDTAEESEAASDTGEQGDAASDSGEQTGVGADPQAGAADADRAAAAHAAGEQLARQLADVTR
jgi:hypothetical protein